jgi:hypothetical protein
MIVSLCRGLCLVPMRSDFITFRRLENLHAALLAKAQTHFRGVWPGNHSIPLPRIPRAMSSLLWFRE